jgi:tetratricopeptide (TPR) repeat protein
MKLMITTAALALLAAAAPASAQYTSSGSSASPQQMPTAQSQQAPAQQQSGGGLMTHQPKLSSGAGKAIVDLQNAVNKNDTASIPAKLAAAKAAAKTGDDKYAIGILELKAANTAKNQAGIAAGLEDMLASGTVKPNEQLGLYQALAQTYSNMNQSQKAIDAYQHIVQLSPNDVNAIAGLAEAQIAAGQTAPALQLLQQGIKAQQAGGQKAPESWYKRAVSVAYNAKLPAALDMARQWVAAYPSPSSWHDAIAIYRNMSQTDVEGTLDLLRLQNAVGALKTSGDRRRRRCARSGSLERPVPRHRLRPEGEAEANGGGPRGGAEDVAQCRSRAAHRRPLCSHGKLREGGRGLQAGAQQGRRRQGRREPAPWHRARSSRGQNGGGERPQRRRQRPRGGRQVLAPLRSAARLTGHSRKPIRGASAVPAPFAFEGQWTVPFRDGQNMLS